MTQRDESTDGYVDIYMLPIPRRNAEAYREQASLFGQITREYGAVRYREFLGDDLPDALQVGEGELLTAAVVDFTSRAHRDEVMANVMSDPRVAEILDGEQLTDMSRMTCGGFETFVSA